MNLREEMSQAVFGKDAQYDRADAALRCVVGWMRRYPDLSGRTLAADIEAMLGKDAQATECEKGEGR